jgi:diguanylate cyclase (GGDEF)-like protein
MSALRLLRSGFALRTIVQILAIALLPLACAGTLLSLQSSSPSHAFGILGAIAFGTACAALALGVWFSRRILARVDELARSARSIATEKAPVPIPVRQGDEFADLAGAFNDIARETGTVVAVQALLAQLDEAMLARVDIPVLARTVLRCIELITRAEVAVLGLFDGEEAQRAQLFVQRKEERNRRVEQLRVELGADLKRYVPLSPTFRSSTDAPLPTELRERLRVENGVTQFFAMPVCGNNQSWGMIVACFRTEKKIADGQVKLLANVSGRLMAGLRSADRERRLHALAFVDSITGMPNRAAFQTLLAHKLQADNAEEPRIGVFVIDLDRFKQVNEAFGHGAGDRVLAQVAKRMREDLIEDDVVARLGGDEFALILSHVASRRDAAMVARKLIKALSRPFQVDGHDVFTGASVGIAMRRDCPKAGEDLLKKAESAMYRAKSSGRNRLAFYEERMNASSRRRSRLEIELRNALKNREFLLHYQPQIDLASGALFGVEALVRWQHPARGLLYPGDFIEDAEAIGLIPEIGNWVMREACLQYTRWRAAGLDVPRVAVNVSNGQLPRSNFLGTVRRLLAETGVPPAALEIEVTETMLVEGGHAAMQALDALATDGVLIAIDDFGTGYSSFNYLKTMPARVLKLDMSFIVDVGPDNDAGKIVSAIINMAHALQKQVVAEGIERADQLMLLKKLGCDRGQGYLLGRPTDAEAIARTYARPLPLDAMGRTVRSPAAQSPAPSLAGYSRDEVDAWNEDEFGEQLTVPRFLDD